METPGSIIVLGPSWHYRLEAEVARSTFGIVWQACWLQTGDTVAVKTVRRDRMASASLGMQSLWPDGLRREIDCLGRLRHRHVVSYRHHGEHEGLPVLALARLHQSLEQRAEAVGGRLLAAEALELVRQVAAGLADLHRYGLRHLDLKPHNLLLTPPGDLGGQLKIADFGTVMGLASSETVDREHAFKGTRGWLAPEQAIPWRNAESDEVHYVYRTDSRTDVYGLGLLLFYLLTGCRTAFSAAVHGLLSIHPGEAWTQRDYLTALAAAGLTDGDRTALAAALDNMQAESGHSDDADGTWVPGGSWKHIDRSSALPAPIPPVLDLLERLLAGHPDNRPQDGSAALAAIVRTQQMINRQTCGAQS